MYTEVFTGEIYVELASKHYSKEKSEWGVNEKKNRKMLIMGVHYVLV